MTCKGWYAIKPNQPNHTEAIWEKAKQKQHRNTACGFERILEDAYFKTENCVANYRTSGK